MSSALPTVATLTLLCAVAAGCASAPASAPPASGVQPGEVSLAANVRDARSIVPPARAPVAVEAACGAAVDLVRASPIAFEGTLVRTLVEVELVAIGPAGLVVSLDSDGRPSFVNVSLAPEVALRLPAGPARDAPPCRRRARRGSPRDARGVADERAAPP